MERRLAGPPLGELFELRPEDVIHPQLSGNLFGYILVSGSAGIYVYLLQEIEISGQRSAKGVLDFLASYAALNVPSDQDEF